MGGLSRNGLGMLDQCVEIGENAQRPAVAVKDVSCTSGPLDGVAEPFAFRPFAVDHLDDFGVAEMVPNDLHQVCPDRDPNSINGEDGCPHRWLRSRGSPSLDRAEAALGTW